jgi:hypothetical protein
MLPRIPITEGRKILRNANFTEGPAAGDRGEVWMDPNGLPHYVAYWGPPFGEDFLQESLDDALAGA